MNVAWLLWEAEILHALPQISSGNSTCAPFAAEMKLASTHFFCVISKVTM